MTLQQEFNSWLTLSPTHVQIPPEINSKAPSSSKLTFPDPNGKPSILAFLRHCGCPFAEKTILTLHTLATSHPNINFLAVSHSTESSTATWIQSLRATLPSNLQVIVDAEREIYAQWGLGTSSAWHVLNPSSMMSVFKLGRQEKIWNRPTESGSRWQTSGSWIVDREGIVKGGGIAKSADDIMDFEEAVRLVE